MTAEEILKRKFYHFKRFRGMSAEKDYIIDAMKEYAKQEVERAAELFYTDEMYTGLKVQSLLLKQATNPIP